MKEDPTVKMSIDSDMVVVYMDIQSTIQMLKDSLQDKLKKNFENFEVWLQNVQVLESHNKLADRCVNGDGFVQVNIEILYDSQRINIVDVVKPTEDICIENGSIQINDNVDTDAAMVNTTIEVSNEREPHPINDTAATSSDDANSNHSSITSERDNMASTHSNEDELEHKQWIVDSGFLIEKRKYGLPNNPSKWSNIHTNVWLKWCISQFDLHIDENDWNLSGKELCELSLEDFQRKMSSNPSNKFCTHLQILQKSHLVTVPGEQNENATAEVKEQPASREQLSCTESNSSNQGNRSGTNVQIQLWQFLLDMLTDRKRLHIIQWINGGDGEFEFLDAEEVAKLWGKEKNKPAMNYEKMSRALRYYYDNDMLEKVKEKRFVYRFKLRLKDLVGFTAQELYDRVHGRPRIRKEQ